MKSFSSVLADRLSAYVTLQRALGLQFERQVGDLHAFDEHLSRRGHTKPLTGELVVAFATDDPASSMDTRARRYHVVRRFCEYLATFDPHAPVLDPKAVPRPNVRPAPQIITDETLATLLCQARHISERFSVHGVTLHAMIGLAASTGLRISEVVRLDRADVDLKTGVLLIRQTKFSKDRYVPSHPTTLEVLRRYAAARDSAYPGCRDPAFFITMLQKRFSRNTLQQQLCKAARCAGLRAPTGKGLSFHHLRHRFAVKRLVAWYEAGIDVQAMLPALATYMGHVHYSDTAYYLTATAELLGLAADRCNRRLEATEAQP
jgi:integrase